MSMRQQLQESVGKPHLSSLPRCTRRHASLGDVHEGTAQEGIGSLALWISV